MHVAKKPILKRGRVRHKVSQSKKIVTQLEWRF
jgi:hypothetical protein